MSEAMLSFVSCYKPMARGVKVRGFLLDAGETEANDDSPIYICTAFHVRREAVATRTPKLVKDNRS